MVFGCRGVLARLVTPLATWVAGRGNRCGGLDVIPSTSGAPDPGARARPTGRSEDRHGGPPEPQPTPGTRPCRRGRRETRARVPRRARRHLPTLLAPQGRGSGPPTSEIG